MPGEVRELLWLEEFEELGAGAAVLAALEGSSALLKMPFQSQVQGLWDSGW